MTLVDAPIPARTTCRSCDSPLATILSLGPIYLSDFPRSAGTRAHPPIPLTLAGCTNPTCRLVQLTHTTPASWMYGGIYWYRSGVNETMVAELRDVVRDATSRVQLQPTDTVVDIGANDGTLLQQYAALGHTKLCTVAWEPVASLYEVLRPHVKVLFPEYFGVVEPWESSSKPKIITAVAMFYDLDNPHAFLEGITRILHPAGVLVVQQAYLPAMLAQADFTNICHEHLEYYDLRAMEAALAPHGLCVIDVEERRINGGSFRTIIGFADHWGSTAAVEAMRRKEQAFYADRPRVFEAFAHRAERVRDQLHAVLDDYHHVGGVVDLYAASTKSNTLLQYANIDARTVRQAWERSPEKWGRYVGVSAIPIVSETEGRADPPAALLVGAWAFKEAFIEREAHYLAAGGRLIFPLPHVETVTQIQKTARGGTA